MTPTPDAAATVIATPAPAAPRASEHARTRTHPNLEHRFGTHGTIDDLHGFDDHAFDVEKTFEYAVHQALCGCLFILVENILPGKRSSLTGSTPQPRTTTHKNSNSATKRHCTGIMIMQRRSEGYGAALQAYGWRRHYAACSATRETNSRGSWVMGSMKASRRATSCRGRLKSSYARVSMRG